MPMPVVLLPIRENNKRLRELLNNWWVRSFATGLHVSLLRLSRCPVGYWRLLFYLFLHIKIKKLHISGSSADVSHVDLYRCAKRWVALPRGSRYRVDTHSGSQYHYIAPMSTSDQIKRGYHDWHGVQMRTMGDSRQVECQVGVCNQALFFLAGYRNVAG